MRNIPNLSGGGTVNVIMPIEQKHHPRIKRDFMLKSQKELQEFIKTFE